MRFRFSFIRPPFGEATSCSQPAKTPAHPIQPSMPPSSFSFLSRPHTARPPSPLPFRCLTPLPSVPQFLPPLLPRILLYELWHACRASDYGGCLAWPWPGMAGCCAQADFWSRFTSALPQALDALEMLVSFMHIRVHIRLSQCGLAPNLREFRQEPAAHPEAKDALDAKLLLLNNALTSTAWCSCCSQLIHNRSQQCNLGLSELGLVKDSELHRS